MHFASILTTILLSATLASAQTCSGPVPVSVLGGAKGMARRPASADAWPITALNVHAFAGTASVAMRRLLVDGDRRFNVCGLR
jgi:hypothetical protein